MGIKTQNMLITLAFLGAVISLGIFLRQWIIFNYLSWISGGITLALIIFIMMILIGIFDKRIPKKAA